ncbi:MAG: GapR family DNA-binding domain-containing protein [Pseudomonadota bacterium]
MAETDQSNTPNPDKVKNYVERMEAIDEERRELNADKSQLMKDAKDDGLNPAVLKKIVKYRRMDVGEREREAEELELYADALGMQLRLPIAEDMPRQRKPKRQLEAVN